MAKKKRASKPAQTPKPKPDEKEWEPTALQRGFLAAYAECGNITAAARAANINPATHRAKWKGIEPYMLLFREAHEQACDALECEARRRAVEGWDEPKFHEGSVCGVVRKFSDTLLIFLMKGAQPEKYRENVSHQHGGEVGLKMYGVDAPVDDV